MAITNSTQPLFPHQTGLSVDVNFSSASPLFGPPPLDHMLRPVDERYPLTEWEFSVKDIFQWGYENFGFQSAVNSISTIAKNFFGFPSDLEPSQTAEVAEDNSQTCASTFGYTLFAESKVTTPGSKIFLSPSIASSKIPLNPDWEKHAGGTYWKYVGSFQREDDEFHEFSFLPSFSFKDPDKFSNLKERIYALYPAVLDTDPFNYLGSYYEKRFLKQLGFMYYFKEEKFQIPSLTTLLKKWDELRLHHPSLPPLHLILCNGVEENSEFITNILDGAIPISINTEFEHDISAHVMTTIQLMTKLLDRMTTEGDFVRYMKAKETNFKVISYLFELLKAPHGKTVSDSLFDQYAENHSSLKQFANEEVKTAFNDFCLTVLGMLADGVSSMDQLEDLITFSQDLSDQPTTIFNHFSWRWTIFFAKKYGEEWNDCFRDIFDTQLLPMIDERSEI